MTNKRATKRKTSPPKASKRKGKRHTHLFGFLKKNPRWAWWVGGIGVVALYIWAFYYFFVGPTGFRWRALYGDARYPQGYEIHGIDISHYQGDINWSKLRHSIIEGCPLRFIIIKSTEGSTRIDEKFKDNFYQAREHG
ncbi:MAG: glycoside hydrolase family 25 protein, partial [Prevotella sp.]|nr:glycoside hydrolase family 25 protein [Prevotella sp.]